METNKKEIFQKVRCQTQLFLKFIRELKGWRYFKILSPKIQFLEIIFATQQTNLWSSAQKFISYKSISINLHFLGKLIFWLSKIYVEHLTPKQFCSPFFVNIPWGRVSSLKSKHCNFWIWLLNQMKNLFQHLLVFLPRTNLTKWLLSIFAFPQALWPTALGNTFLTIFENVILMTFSNYFQSLGHKRIF